MSPTATLHSRVLTHRERKHTMTFRPYSDGRVQVCSHDNVRDGVGWPHMESKRGALALERKLRAEGYEAVGFEKARAEGLFTAPSWPVENAS